MKQSIVWLLVLATVLTLCACGKQKSEATTTVPTTIPTEVEQTTVPTEATELDWEPGVVRADGYGLVWCAYQRGDTVTVIGKLDGYYVVEDAQQDHLIEERFVRLSTEETLESDDGYAKYKTTVHATAYLDGEPLATLNFNTKVQILDSKGNWMYIQWADGEGYVSIDQISPWYMNTQKTDGTSDSDYSYSGGDSSSAGGSSSSGGNSSSGSSGQDGSDVDLGSLSAMQSAYQVVFLGAYNGPEYEKLDTCQAMVLSDETEGYWMILRRGDEVKVTNVAGEKCTLYVDGTEVIVPRWILQMSGDTEYESWMSYSRYKTIAYSDYLMTKEVATFRTNQRIEVVDELAEMGLYVVKLEDGSIAYVSVKGLQKYAVSSGNSSSGNSSDDYTGSYDGGGSSSGGNDSNNGGSSSSVEEWTPPVL